MVLEQKKLKTNCVGNSLKIWFKKTKKMLAQVANRQVKQTIKVAGIEQRLKEI